MEHFPKTVVVTGHYGSGKTNLSLNLAMELRRRGEKVALADLDIVNPYFRSADFCKLAKTNGIALVASEYAGSTLDVPALSGQLDAAIGGEHSLIIDVGGDDVGAYALGRYAPRLTEVGYSMFYVINKYRYLVKSPNESRRLLLEIEAASGLKGTHIANCSNLGEETTAEDIRASRGYAQQISEATGLPIILTAARPDLAPELQDMPGIFPTEIYVKAPWNETAE